jgi:hypothetical protein
MFSFQMMYYIIIIIRLSIITATFGRSSVPFTILQCRNEESNPYYDFFYNDDYTILSDFCYY